MKNQEKKMKFFQDLYLGEGVSPKINQIMKKLNSGILVPELYLIVMSNNADNMLELIPQWEVLQKGYPDVDLKVVGLASGKKEAVSLVQFIVEQAFQDTGSADVRPYLDRRWEEQL